LGKETIRSFIAIEVKESETLKKIQEFTSRLKKNQPRIKIVETENIHMTVKFLGDIHVSTAPKIYEILKEEINENLFSSKEYKYTVKGAGQFNRFSVLWVKLEGDIQFLQKIKDRVEKLLKERLKIQKDKRSKFKPHITIGRLRSNKIDYKTFDIFKKLVNESKDLEFGTCIISKINLKQSVLTPKGPIYSDLVY
jgi:2'-5' RNA ligase